MKNIEALSDHELDLMMDIGTRAVKILKDLFGLQVNISTIVNALALAHLNGCKLNLNGLLDANKADFCHDIGGILSNLNQANGKIENCFLPRFADLS